MAQVIERHGHHIDDAGFIHYDDRPISWVRAEYLAGRKLDRRRNYAIVDGTICQSAQWTALCSGCDGAGCHECGHTGKRRQACWIPINGHCTEG